jgi:hypothetical protein
LDTHAYAYVTTYTSADYTSAHNCHACANADANRCADHINPNTLSCYSGSDMGSNVGSGVGTGVVGGGVGDGVGEFVGSGEIG